MAVSGPKSSAFRTFQDPVRQKDPGEFVTSREGGSAEFVTSRDKRPFTRDKFKAYILI